MNKKAFAAVEKKYAADIKVSLTRKAWRKIKSEMRQIFRGGTEIKRRSNANYGILLTFEK